MNVYRKSLVVQIILFFVFFIIGANLIITYFFGQSAPWIGYIVIVLLVAFGVFGFSIYRKPDTRISVVTKKEMNLIKYMLYGYFGIYVLQLILQTISGMNLMILAVVSGVILMVIALVGMYIQYRIIKIK